jgi:hypothetical protein
MIVCEAGDQTGANKQIVRENKEAPVITMNKAGLRCDA